MRNIIVKNQEIINQIGKRVPILISVLTTRLEYILFVVFPHGFCYKDIFVTPNLYECFNRFQSVKFCTYKSIEQYGIKIKEPKKAYITIFIL